MAPNVLSRVLNVVTRALSTAVLNGAGLSRSAGAHTGIVTAMPRLGSALNLNAHLHLLVLDGGCTFAVDRARFHRAPVPSQAELERVLDTLITRITRTMVRGWCTGRRSRARVVDLEQGSAPEQLSAAARAAARAERCQVVLTTH